jgi:hypothetical protein
VWPAVQSSNFIFVSDILCKMLNFFILEICIFWKNVIGVQQLRWKYFFFFMDKAVLAHYILRLITKLHRRNERTVMNLFETNLNSF